MICTYVVYLVTWWQSFYLFSVILYLNIPWLLMWAIYLSVYLRHRLSIENTYNINCADSDCISMKVHCCSLLTLFRCFCWGNLVYWEWKEDRYQHKPIIYMNLHWLDVDRSVCVCMMIVIAWSLWIGYKGGSVDVLLYVLSSSSHTWQSTPIMIIVISKSEHQPIPLIIIVLQKTLQLNNI